MTIVLSLLLLISAGGGAAEGLLELRRGDVQGARATFRLAAEGFFIFGLPLVAYQLGGRLALAVCLAAEVIGFVCGQHHERRHPLKPVG
jgi:hypothetical protein